jgi:hypothetical protein
MSLEKCNELIGNRTRDLQACSRVHQSTIIAKKSHAHVLVSRIHVWCPHNGAGPGNEPESVHIHLRQTLVSLLNHQQIETAGSTIIQAASCRLPTVVAHVRSQVTSRGICG